jgi:hypothetical protein
MIAREIQQQPHHSVDLRARSRPARETESVERQVFDTQLGCCLDGAPCSLRSFDVSRDTRERARTRPATISVHDDRDVSRGDRRRVRADAI